MMCNVFIFYVVTLKAHHNTMRTLRTTIQPKVTIPMFGFGCLPFPAFVTTSNINFLPKTIHNTPLEC